MNLSDIVLRIGDWVIAAALLPNLVFAVRYFLFSPYKLTPEGRNMLHKKVALSSLIVLILLAVVFGDYPGREWLRLVVFGAVTLFFSIETIQLIKLQEKFPYNRWNWLGIFRAKGKRVKRVKLPKK